MIEFSPNLLCDFYKISHREQYPQGTEYVYSTWIPRASRIAPINKVVAFGFQGFIKDWLIDYFDDNFFGPPLENIIRDYTRLIENTLGVANPETQHIADLHELGYLPLEIKAVAEGTQVPLRVPMLTIENTDPRFYWLVNYFETLFSCEVWQPSTSATIAHEYRRILDFWANLTGGDKDFVAFQGHDFSMRGMAGVYAAASSGAGHLLSFTGTDTIPAIEYAEWNYNADITESLVGTSIPATEHSVMCAYGTDELASYKRLIQEVYPNGMVSIVSDTWDLWNVITNVVGTLKEQILERDGKVVIRPDSGDPVNIICGDPNADPDSPAYKGVIELLWDIFGGDVNDKGYRQLDSHIGAIYGDAITLDRVQAICERLAAKNFASTNMVYGIGSYTYQFQTRDTFSFALKSTWVQVNGEGRNIYKDPVTDNGTKKSLTGRVVVVPPAHATSVTNMIAIDGLDRSQQSKYEAVDMLRPIYRNGELLVDDNFNDIRSRLNASA